MPGDGKIFGGNISFILTLGKLDLWFPAEVGEHFVEKKTYIVG